MTFPFVIALLQTDQTERCETEKWQFLFFCLTSFCLVAEMMITAKGDSTCLIENAIVYFQ